MRFRQLVWIPAFLAASLAATASAATLPPAADAGIQWLQAQLQADGSLSNESLSIASPLQARSETATALGLAGPVPASLTSAVAADTGTDTESLSRHVIALVQAGQDPTAAVQALYANQNADGGFGSLAGDSSDPLDTAFALLALRTANNASAANLSNALLYMVGSVGADGGYGLPAGGSGSQVYVTAYVLLAYQAYATSYPLTQQISGARHWLTQQQTGGVYGDALSDAIAVLALAASSSDTSAYSSALNALSASQQPDGSWGDDPYLTAMAIRALGVGVAQAAANTGSITGSVLDAVSRAPIAGTQIEVSGPASMSGVSSGSGTFSLGSLVPGIYTVSVAAAGYGGATLQNIQVNAAATTTLGTLLLSPTPNLAGISGTLADANGVPVAGAVITVSGADAISTTSASNGSYSFFNLAPGAVTLTVSATGYDSLTVPAALAGGVVLNFSPALYPTGTTPSGASLVGSVEDAQTGAALAGAAISLGSASVQTDSSGRFDLSGLSAGVYTATVSANGYSGATLSGSLADGANNAGLVLLSLVAPANNMSAVSGTVTDSSTGKPIAGASVQVQSTTIATVTDTSGNYQLTGISGSQFVVLFTAPGYMSKDSGVSLAAPAAVTLNAALVPAGSTNLLVKSLSLDHSNYDPYTEAEISAEIDNTGSQDQSVILDAQIVDALGNVVQDIPAIGLNLSTPPSAALQTVPAGGSLDHDFTFYVRNTLAGTYRVVIQATDGNGNVVAEGGTALAVNPLAQIGGGLTLNPPITQANANQPIHVTGTVSNLGNLPLNAGMLQLSVSVGDNASATSAPTPPIALSTFYAEGDYTGPVGGAKDAQGNMYVVDTYFGGPTFKVHKIAPDGSSSLLATIPGSVTVNGIGYSVNNGARSVQPSDLAVDPSGNVWVLNSHNFIVKITPAGSLSYVDTGMPTLRYIESDPSGNLYFTGANGTNNLLVEMSPSGQFTTLVQNGISQPGYITASPAGDLYVTNFGDNTVSKVALGGVISTFATGLSGPQGIVSDAAGNLYVANSGANDVVMISPTGVPQVFATGFNNPAGLAFDSQGVLYVTNTGDNSISKVTSDGHVTTFAQSAASNPQGLSYDAQGNLYIANAGNNTVTEVDVTGKARVVATGLSSPEQPVVDSAGNIFVANYGSGAVTETTNGTTTTLASGLDQPYGVALDQSANVYVTEYGASRIDEVSAGGGAPQSIAVSLLRLPGALTLAPDGSLIVSNYYAGISRIPLGGGGQILSTIGGQAGPTSFDSSGALYFTQGTNLYKVVNGANVPVATIPSTEAPAVFDAQGNYYIADYNNKRIVKVSGGVTSVFAVLSGNPTWLAEDSAGNLYTVVHSQYVYMITQSAVISQITNVHLSNDIKSLTVDPNGRLVVANYNGTVFAMDQAGTTLAVLSGLPAPGGAVALANGDFVVTDNNNNALRVYSPQGALQQEIYGFYAPKYAAWYGNELLFVDYYGRLFSLVPGGYPQFLGGISAGPFALLGNTVYYVNSNNGINSFNLSTKGSALYYSMGSGYYGYPNGVAARSDGTVAITEPVTDEIVIVNPTRQLAATYTGINSPVGIAIDTSGDVFVAGRFPSYGGAIVELSPSGTTAKPVGVLSNAYGLGFDAAGHLDIGGGGAIYQANLATGNLNPTKIASTSGTVDLRGLAFSNGTLYATDHYNQAVRDMSGSNLPVYAYGIAAPYGVRLGPDGAFYVVDRTSGSVMRYSQGTLSIAATGIANAVSVNFDPDRTMYVGTTASGLYKTSAAGQLSDMGLESLLGNSGIENIYFDGSGDPLIVLPRSGGIDAVVMPKPPAPPAPGTVVYTTTVPSPALVMGTAPVSVDFGSWTPRFAGDYTFTVTSAQSGTAGSLDGSLHVGSYATGQLSADATTLPPGNQAVNLSLSMQGLDFSSIANVEASNIQINVATGGGTVPPAMGMAPDGSLDFLNGAYLTRIAPDGTKTVSSYLSPAPLRGDLPIDTQGNVYVNPGSGIIKYNPITGQRTPYSSLGGVWSMSFAGDGTLYAASAENVYAVAPDGSYKLFYNSPTAFSGVAADAAGDVFLQTNNDLVMVKPDGTASLLDDKGSYEGEGRNIAGACANNMFFTPDRYPGSGQSGEEHTLMEYVGDTGQIAPVFNGLTINASLGDMDFITYDRYHSNLLMWTDGGPGYIFSLPVFCGGIDVEAHVVSAAGQTLSGFSAAPTQTIANANGTTEYVWDLKSVTTLGAGLQFGTVLDGLQIGQARPTVQSAYLVFKNSFVANSDITLPLTVPTVHVDPAVSLVPSTDQASYPDATPVDVSVSLHNSSVSDVGGLLDVKILAADGSVAADIDTQTADIPAGGSVVEPALWNTGGYLDGAYTVSATLKDPDGTLLAQGTSAFSIGVSAGPTGPLTAGVTTDKASYSPIDLVAITDRLTDTASNSLDGNIALTTSVTGPDGSLIWSSGATVEQLAPGAIRDLPYQLPLANAAPGSYTVTLAATLDGAALPVATAHFTVQSSSDTASGVRGALSVTPAQAPIGTAVHLSGSLTDDGNAALGNLTATLAILDPVAGQLVFQAPVSAASLAQGASLPLQTDWTAAGTANQVYIAVLMVNTGGATKTLAQANLTLLPPPDPTADLTGTLGSSPVQVVVGNSVNLAGAVDNTGVQVTGITASITVQDAGGNTVYQNQMDLGTLAAGSSTPVLASWNGGVVDQAYTAVLSVSGSGKTKTLAQTQFSVVPPPVSMTASLGLGQHGRVLILTDAPGSGEPNGPSGAPGITAQNQHLASVLTAAGWSYRIVTTADDFETQFNTGGYDVYVVLSESVKLPTQFQLQLDQEVNNGAGLVVAGNHDDRNNKLEEALGIHSTGKSLSVTGLSLDASGLVPAGGQAAFPLDPSPESVNKASASVMGEFQVSRGSAAPAVFSNDYGKGKAVYVAFDLGMEEAAAGNGNLFDTLFLGALGYVHPATLTPYQGTVMPFVLTVTNTGVATPGQATATLPAGMSVVDPQTGMVSGNSITWTFNLTQGQVLTLPFWAALPAQAGSVTLTAVVQSGASPDLTVQATPSLVVGVQSGGGSVCKKLVTYRHEPAPATKHDNGADKDQH